MHETQLKNLLAQTDQVFGTKSKTSSEVLAQNAFRRAAIRKRRQAEILASGTLLLLGACLLGYRQFDRYQEKKQAALQAEIRNELADLKTEAEYTLALIRFVNQQTQRQRQLAALRQRLASITEKADPTESQDEQLAGVLYQKAQTLSVQAHSCNTVKMLYQQIIQTFPNSSYTNSAKQELAQLDCSNGLRL